MVPPTRTSVSSTPITSPDTMDMLSSSLMGTWRIVYKDSAHQRRTGGRTGLTVDFTSDMAMKSKKEVFLSNKTKKQKFIMLLSDCLDQAGCEIHHALGDAVF